MYWRHAGISYLKYANTCAEAVRSALKPGPKAAAKAREAVYFKQTNWKDGKPDVSVITDLLEGTKAK